MRNPPAGARRISSTPVIQFWNFKRKRGTTGWLAGACILSWHNPDLQH
jgi:hypothetical protein